MWQHGHSIIKEMAATRLFVRGLHTTRSLPMWFMTPLARILVAVGARAGRSVWGRMGKESRQTVKNALLKRSGYIIGGIGGTTVCGIGWYVYHIEEAPVTGRNRFMMINRHKLLKMIDHEKEAIVQSLVMGMPVLPVSDPSYSQVVPILERIILVSKYRAFGGVELQDTQWTVIMLDSPDVANAVCLPSGEIIVHSGLLKACHNQDELAFVLSHEVAHVLMNHGGEIFSNKGLMDFFLLFVTAAVWFVVPSDFISYILHKWSHSLAEVLFKLPYSRQLEEEADTVGLQLLSCACFQPSKSVEVWAHLPSASSMEYLSTHPLHENRLGKLKDQLPIAKELWEANQCHKMHAETIRFKKLVSKTLFDSEPLKDL